MRIRQHTMLFTWQSTNKFKSKKYGALMTQRIPITNDVIIKLNSMVSFNKLFPYQRKADDDNSFYKLQSISISCSQCKKDIPQNHSYGLLAECAHNTNLEAYGLCVDCKLITPVTCRFRDDGSYLIKSSDGWKERFSTNFSKQKKYTVVNKLTIRGFFRDGWKHFFPPVIAGIIISIWVILGQ